MDNKKEKILIIRLGAIGDVVHTTNTYRAVKKANNLTEIHYLTTSTQACFLENDPEIDKVWAIKKEELNLNQIKILANKLKNENYTIAINLQPNFKTRLLVFLSGIKKQLIYKKSFKQHAVENFFQTAKNYFKNITLPNTMRLYISDEARNYAKAELKNLKRPLIALNAGGIFSPRQGRTYPIEKWIEAGTILAQKYNASLIFTGAKEDEKALLPLTSIPYSVSFVGKTTLEQNAALIEQCDLMISGDSGPLHIATALGVPSIGLYGSMPIQRTGTFGINCQSIKSNLKCVPCNRRKCKYIKGTTKIYTPCMEAIKPEDIIETAEKLLFSKSSNLSH